MSYLPYPHPHLQHFNDQIVYLPTPYGYLPHYLTHAGPVPIDISQFVTYPIIANRLRRPDFQPIQHTYLAQHIDNVHDVQPNVLNIRNPSIIDPIGNIHHHNTEDVYR